MIDDLAAMLADRRVVALTGAGCSTESGIPDYRGPGATTPRRPPIQYREFMDRPDGRRRYWARAVLGWPRIRDATPNPAHRALAGLERRGALAGLITQNVDGLHGAAGSRRVVELHGALALVRCTGCGARTPRADLQRRLLDANPGWLEVGDRAAAAAPDGDAQLPDDAVAGFVVVACEACGGVLKPDVVFFGENVPRDTTDAAWALFDRAEVLLVVGSSLTVFSGYRFVRRAAERGVPVAIVNRGPTRGDDAAQVRVDGLAGEVLPALAAALGGPRPDITR
ncbi:MAG: NAD-dependent protein deacetylase [Kofleriaceae bacterium]|nr:NAD-dependent protein deacetylase [Kofleriaceae bacterium]